MGEGEVCILCGKIFMLLTLSSDDFLDLAEAVLRRGQPLRFRATGTSMAPSIRSGDLLTVDPVDARALRPGDVALYRSERGPRVHRLTRRAGATFRLQGDAPGCLVEEVPAAEVLGRVVLVERGGGQIRLDRGMQGAMRWSVARAPGGRRLARIVSGWGSSLCERWDRDARDLRRLLRLCAPSQEDRDLPDSEAGWERLIALAETRDLAPLLYCQAREVLPPAAARTLSGAYYVSAARCAVLTDAVGKVLTALREADVPTVVLKGAALSETVYPSPAARPMTDVDLLVSPDRLRAADGALARLGYCAVDGRAEEVDPARPTSLSTLDYRAPDPLAPSVHLHWHLVNTSIPTEAYRDFIRLDEVWDAALPFAVAGATALRLAPHHLLVYLCEHALRPSHAFYKPLHLTDLAWVIAREGPDWGQVIDVAQRFRLARLAYFGLRIVQEQMGAPVPGEVLVALRPDCLTRGERYFLRQALRGRARPGTSTFIHLALRRTALEKARFLLRILFPPLAVVAHHAPGSSWRWYLGRGASALKHALWPV
ncbi:MAG: hypothetical protein A3F84_10845 [Candidatus Handelsmanbacteria bacterium RIFCSPLOWO2_12_FULL_64_10]|uniref:Peptidase S24/S26A/S26B/S26C domain-containing protein n=1 Tax=Handelsmanbacteria sp. (strain RIFCSPLOWO2_12_FULL_64_10) TaxID=1817868 RepID=A0A1F6D614_HANXR|nr:MAG: hypothetical protein A3F84_10845 [Candidatus Handelsmanbacteria bacterium RIFCSPLOWO2_12_FULL_64_10]